LELTNSRFSVFLLSIDGLILIDSLGEFIFLTLLLFPEFSILPGVDGNLFCFLAFFSFAFRFFLRKFILGNETRSSTNSSL
jgi:hypothetical protein